jgi:hypothetical protein
MGGAPKTKARELMTLHAATQLAGAIMRYWHDQGHLHVVAWVEPEALTSKERHLAGSSLYVVRSNLVNGAPPRPAKAA